MKRAPMFIVAAAVVLAAPRAGIAQEKSTAQLVPLKLQLVISRHTGEKKISSLPYILWITANKPGETSLRMGVEVPVVASRFSPKAGEVAPSYNYRPVGTNIDCSAATVADGWFNVNITLSDSAVQFDSKDASRSELSGLPAFRSFTSKFSILLKDGQTAQYTSATDPVSGEVLRVDVTLNVLK